MTQENKIQIALVGGGTGGHLFPAIALGEVLVKHQKYDIYVITDERCSRYIIAGGSLSFEFLKLRISYRSLYTKICSVFGLLKSTLHSFWLLRKIKPSLIVGFGGYVAFPPLMAALVLNIPIIIYEPNSVMGKVNKFFLKFARHIALAYNETKDNISSPKAIVVGDLVRKQIQEIEVKQNFDNPVFRLFVFGGSQSAKIFSHLIPKTIKLLTEIRPDIQIEIMQQARRDEHIEIAQIYDNIGIKYTLAEFYHDIAECYQNSELVICRAGSSTIAELTYIGLPAIFIPFPQAAENHQLHNAMALAKIGGSWCFEQAKITPQILANKLIELMDNRKILQKASANLLTRKQDGASLMAKTIEKISLIKNNNKI